MLRCFESRHLGVTDNLRNHDHCQDGSFYDKAHASIKASDRAIKVSVKEFAGHQAVGQGEVPRHSRPG